MPREAIDQVVLAAVRFIGDNDDIAPVAQRRHLLAFLRQEFLDGREHHSTTRHRQQLAQLRTVCRLHWCLS